MRLFSLAVFLLFSVVGCAPNQLIRGSTEACNVAPNDAEAEGCRSSSIENHDAENYGLGFVEFDDQGSTYDDRRQMTALFRRLEAEAETHDLCMIVFVHGWKHNASYEDGNVQDFRRLLRQVAQVELERKSGERARKVFGIYAGWRGLSIDAGEVGRDLTFWTRKNAAHRVAEGSIRELLARTQALQTRVNKLTWADGSGRSTRLLTIGHSFGGLIVYTALHQYLIDGAAVLAESSEPVPVPAFGDLVVLVNPAFEAVRYEPIREIIRQQNAYVRKQNPVFVAVTSKGDWATGYAFPAGRIANTIVEGFKDDAEREEARTALGHYKPFWTHELTAATPDAPARAVSMAAANSPVPVQQECRDFEAFNAQWRVDGHLKPGWTRQYTSGAVLHHLAEGDRGYHADNPYWIVSADPAIIKDHNDIQSPIFVDFVRQLYDDLVRLTENVQCAR